MPSKKKPQPAADQAPVRLEHDDTAGVTAFMDALEHPLKPALAALRAEILAAEKGVTEGIKWKAPSFSYYGWFATVNIRAGSLQLILHHGVKPQKESTLPDTIDDPDRLLKWLARDRATISFSSAQDFAQKQKSFKKIIKQWVKHQALLTPHREA